MFVDAFSQVLVSLLWRW